MPKVDKIVNVIDDSLTHRELVDLDSGSMTSKEHKLYAVQIQDLHQDRLVRYATKRNISMHTATYELMRLHSEKVNIASHISSVIGEQHSKYMLKLQELHENPWFIR
jgi:hypothetical protein